jgi:protein-S-isoprenylcysteine O-methyltransferase Ste14
MASFGKSTIAAPVLILGKLSLLGCWVFYFLAVTGILQVTANKVLWFTAGFLGALGCTMMAAGIIGLGKSVSVGLPEEETSLKTSGIFRITRNPVYVGSHLLCIGSCLLTMNYLNILLLAAAIIIHHFIIIKEEEFLENKFGPEWLNYKAATARYIFF